MKEPINKVICVLRKLSHLHEKLLQLRRRVIDTEKSLIEVRGIWRKEKSTKPVIRKVLISVERSEEKIL